MYFENNGLVIQVLLHATYIGLWLYDNRYIKSVARFATIGLNRTEAQDVLNTIYLGKYKQTPINISGYSLEFSPIESDLSKIRLMIEEKEFNLDYDWLKQVFKRILAEAEALED